MILFEIPRELLVHILTVYLNERDLSRLDIAISVHKYRQVFLEVLRSQDVCFQGCKSIEWDMVYGCSYALWLVERQISVRYLYLREDWNDSGRNITDDVISAIRYDHMVALSLSDCQHISSDGLRLVVDKCCEEMSAFILEDVTCVVTASTVSSLCRRCPYLKVFHIKDGTIRENYNFDSQLEALQTLRHNLQSLAMTDYLRVSSEVLIESFRSFRSLKKLNVGGCDYVNDSLLLALVEHVPGLCHLDLSFCYNVTSVGILAIVRGLGGLVSLNLSLLGDEESDVAVVSDEVLTAIGANCINLQWLYLACGLFTDVGVSQLKHCRRLKHVNLDHCSNVLGPGIVAMAEGCPDMQSIIGLFDEDTLVGVTAHCRHLKDVCIGSNIDVSASIRVLHNCLELEHLQCYVGFLDDATLIEITRHCKNLRTFSGAGGNNTITNVGAFYLLEHCPLMFKCWIQNCTLVSEDAKRQIRQVCTARSNQLRESQFIFPRRPQYEVYEVEY